MDSKIYQFQIKEITIPYELINNEKSKSIRISIGIEGMKVSKPKRVKLEQVEELLSLKANWIYKHYIQFEQIKTNKYKRQWQSEEKVLYKGIEHSAKIHEYNGKKARLEFGANNFEIFVNNTLSSEEKKESIEDAFKKWFIKMAKEAIGERLEFYCNKIGLSYNKFKIKEQKTRWGSCSKQKNLNLNWKLIMAPPWVADYVVLHEVCHLKYLNHSKDYWNMVSLYMPEYKKAQQWLKKNGQTLGI